MSKKNISYNFSLKENNNEIIDLATEKKRKLYINMGLFAVYTALLILSLFII